MGLRFLNPVLFQGNLKKKNYFEGWYFKHVSSDLEHVWSFIPGISLNREDPHAFIQVLNGITGESDYISYPVDKFIWNGDNFFLRVGDSSFTERCIDLNIRSRNLNLAGHIEYSNNVRYPRTLISPGIMGWYSFVPFMECKHGIVSVIHDLSGTAEINGNTVNFNGGKGYAEKDWGTSFPEAWMWIQSNNFLESGTSFTFSVAKIPWLGRFFMGFISFFYHNGRFYLFSTYNGSEITEILHDSTSVRISMKNRDCTLVVFAVKNRFGELRVPTSGKMTRRIKESIDSTLDVKLSDNQGKAIFSGTGRRAGLEITENIYDYL